MVSGLSFAIPTTNNGSSVSFANNEAVGEKINEDKDNVIKQLFELIDIVIFSLS